MTTPTTLLFPQIQQLYHDTLSDERAWVPIMVPRLSTEDASETTKLWVCKADLCSMVSMGLGHLPVDAIAVADYSEFEGMFSTEPVSLLDIAHKLTRFFPGHFVAALYELQQVIRQGGFKAYVVGGIPRDLLWGNTRCRSIIDADLTIQGDAIACAEYIVHHSRNFTLQATYPDYGTATIVYKDDITFDLASTRKEYYAQCAAMPQVVARGVPLPDDLSRRDFTMNTLAISLNDLQHVIDYTHGIEAIERKEIRVLSTVTFFEDPSRILRAFKFAARYDFQFSPVTTRIIEAFLRYAHLVYKGGGDRIKDELRDLFSIKESSRKAAMLRHFLSMNVHRVINTALPNLSEPALARFSRPVIDAMDTVEERLGRLIPAGAWQEHLAWDIYLCFLFDVLPAERIEETMLRFGLTKVDKDIIDSFRWIVRQPTFQQLNEQTPPAAIYDLYYHRPFAAMIAAALTHENVELAITSVMHFKNKWEGVHPELDGSDLLQLGIPQGEGIGKMLRALVHQKLSGALLTRIDEVRFVQQKLEQSPELTMRPPESST